ncbi:MAG TPA: molybdenum cofactor biosynthesis protein MoaE [Thermoanaerobaculia bacterium]|nr:molybdenum cofactor biosynthesis protein MoaE [Thermoanaerobaculia bacterium]
MKVRLVSFATASDAMGSSELELELANGTTVAELQQQLEQRYPDLGKLWSRLAIAIDGEVVAGSARLREGCEVALLPPVSGGSPAPDRAELTEAPLRVAEIADRVTHGGCGALVLFVGTVRDTFRGRAVERITYSGYTAMAQARLARIVEELEREHPGGRVAIVHRLGTLAVGEASVVIAVTTPHREAAYEASRRALERLKREVPIWKREHYRDGGAAWREEESLLAPVSDSLS